MQPIRHYPVLVPLPKRKPVAVQTDWDAPTVHTLIPTVVLR